MQISAAQSSIWQQDSQNRSFLNAMATISLTIVEADDKLYIIFITMKIWNA